jgi:anti-anti-sigma factor
MAERADGDWDGSGPPPRSVSAVPQLVAEHEHTHGGLRVAGAIDVNSYDAWERALRETADRGAGIALDLTDVEFIDARGVAALVDVASGLPEGHRIVVHRPPRGMRRIMRALWPQGVAAIVMEGAAT